MGRSESKALPYLGNPATAKGATSYPKIKHLAFAGRNGILSCPEMTWKVKLYAESMERQQKT